MNKKCLFAVVIGLVSLICLSACGALRDTADKNKALNESLPYYELNAANYDEISYNGLTCRNTLIVNDEKFLICSKLR